MGGMPSLEDITPPAPVIRHPTSEGLLSQIEEGEMKGRMEGGGRVGRMEGGIRGKNISLKIKGFSDGMSCCNY